MSIEDDIAFLERVPTLGLLGRDALRILAISAESRSVQSGNVLFRDGEVADAGYVIQEGSFSLAPERPGSVEPVKTSAYFVSMNSPLSPGTGAAGAKRTGN